MIFVAVIETVVLARLLGPASFGAAALIMSVPTLIFTFFDPRSGEALVKYMTEFLATNRRNEAAAMLRLGLCSDVLLSGVGILSTAAAAYWAQDHIVHRSNTAALIVAFAVAQAFSAPSNTARAALTVAGEFSLIATLQAGRAIAAAALTISLVVAGHGVAGVVVGNGTAMLLDGLLAAAFASRAIRRRSGTSWLRTRTRHLGGRRREIVRFMVFTDMTSLATLFVKQADLAFVGYFGTSRDAGLYQLARTIASPLGNNLVTPLQAVTYPRLSDIAAREPTAAVFARGKRYLLLAGVPLGALILLSLPLVRPVTTLVGGSRFVGAGTPAVILLVGSGITLMFFWVRPMVLALGEVGSLLTIGIAGFVFCLVGYPLAAFWAGATGVAAVRSIVTLIGNIGGLWYATRRIRRRELKAPAGSLMSAR